MPGDAWQKRANLKALFALMYAQPGRKLMFMGCEFGQDTEWNHDKSLPWHLLDQTKHLGVQRLVRDLNKLYRDTPALHQLDCDASGFEWLVTDDANQSVFAWLRKGNDPKSRCVVVVNFTPEIRRNYRVRVPFAGRWREALNTDAAHYGGSNTGNAGVVSAVVTPESPELHLVLPPLAAIYLVSEV